VTRTVRVNTTLDADLLERIDAFASERREDPVSYTHLTLPTICSV